MAHRIGNPNRFPGGRGIVAALGVAAVVYGFDRYTEFDWREPVQTAQQVSITPDDLKGLGSDLGRNATSAANKLLVGTGRTIAHLGDGIKEGADSARAGGEVSGTSNGLPNEGVSGSSTTNQAASGSEVLVSPVAFEASRDEVAGALVHKDIKTKNAENLQASMAIYPGLAKYDAGHPLVQLNACVTIGGGMAFGVAEATGDDVLPTRWTSVPAAVWALAMTGADPFTGFDEKTQDGEVVAYAVNSDPSMLQGAFGLPLSGQVSPEHELYLSSISPSKPDAENSYEEQARAEVIRQAAINQRVFSQFIYDAVRARGFDSGLLNSPDEGTRRQAIIQYRDEVVPVAVSSAANFFYGDEGEARAGVVNDILRSLSDDGHSPEGVDEALQIDGELGYMCAAN
jgi:hypothetical protein